MVGEHGVVCSPGAPPTTRKPQSRGSILRSAQSVGQLFTKHSCQTSHSCHDHVMTPKDPKLWRGEVWYGAPRQS